MSPDRPALAAVLDALDGVTDPGEAVEILTARDLWPVEDAPVMWTAWSTAGLFDCVISVASIGVAAIVRAQHLAREVARERGASSCVVEWTAMSGVAHVVSGVGEELRRMGIEVWGMPAEPPRMLLTVPPM